jgi:succinate dehydrogenase/fumarate reductase cytochrome b subunit
MDSITKLPRGLHRIGAGVVGVYVLAHLANHLAALGGIGTHIAFMQEVRQVSRVPAMEALLLAGAAVQAASGLLLLLRRRSPRRMLFDRLQAFSGAYLAFFLLVHVVSVLVGRAVPGLDTNFYFAAAGLQVWPYPLFFVPYYGLAVAALFTHLGCALRRRLPPGMPLVARDRIGYAGIAAGMLLAGVIVATFSGMLYAIDLPAEYLATFR